MKKKIVATLLVMIMVFAMACPGAFAEAASPADVSYVSSLRYCLAVAAVEACNYQVEAYVRHAQMTPYNDIPWLMASTDALIRSTTGVVKALGFNVQCVYEEYYVDGHVVLIDPLRVINPIDKKENG